MTTEEHCACDVRWADGAQTCTRCGKVIYWMTLPCGDCKELPAVIACDDGERRCKGCATDAGFCWGCGEHAPLCLDSDEFPLLDEYNGACWRCCTTWGEQR